MRTFAAGAKLPLTKRSEVIEVIPLARVKVAADWPLEKVLSAVVHDAAAHACSM